jgi:hypothetical protein
LNSRVSAPYDAELPFRREPDGAYPSTASIPEVSSAEMHACRIQICVGLVPAGHAAEPIALAARGVHSGRSSLGVYAGVSAPTGV